MKPIENVLDMMHQATDMVGPMTSHQPRLQLLLDTPILDLLIQSPHYHTNHSILLPAPPCLVRSSLLLSFQVQIQEAHFQSFYCSKSLILYPLECHREVHGVLPLKTLISYLTHCSSFSSNFSSHFFME